MFKPLFCCAVFAITFYSAVSIRIDPAEVRHLVQFIFDFKASFCKKEDPIAFCFATTPQIFDAFLAELKAQKMELLKSGAQKPLALFDLTEQILGESIILKERAEQKGRLVCQFAVNALELFTEDFLVRRRNEQQREVMEKEHGINEEEYEKYIILLGIFKECEDSLNDNENFLKELPSIEFDWTVKPKGQLGSVKLQELENPFEIKLLAQLMINFAKDLSTDMRKISKVFTTNVFAFGAFEEALEKINAENSALIKKGSFIDQLNTLAKNCAQHNTGVSEAEVLPDTDGTQFGHALSKFFGDVLTDFFDDANGIFSRSEMGKEMLKKRGLDENALKEYEYLAKGFHENSKELKFGKKITKFGWNVTLEKDTTAQNSLKLEFDLFKKIEFDLFKQMKFEFIKEISVKFSQITQFIEIIKTMEKNPNWVNEIENIFEFFYNNRDQNAIFEQLVQIWAKILSIREVSGDEQLKQYVLCNFLFTFGTLVVYGAIVKAKVNENNGTNYSKQLDALVKHNTPDITTLTESYKEKVVMHYQGMYQDYAGKVLEKLKQKKEVFNEIISIDGLVRATQFVYEWEDGTFPFPKITEEEINA